jgi:anaerobic sulfatase-maturating enzyme
MRGTWTLLEVALLSQLVEPLEKHRRPEQQVSYTLQTNGTRLDDAWCAFFKKHGFLIGLSVDGLREMHDAYRVNKGGAGTFDQVMQGLACLKKHGVDFNILCTVHAANEDHPLEVYRFFRDELGARHLQFIPIVERVTAELLPMANQGWGERPGGERPLYTQAGSLVTNRSVKAQQYGCFLVSIFEEWVRRDVGEVYVQMFDAALGAHVGLHSLCIFAPTCGNALALEHNGDLYSCDHYVEPDYLLGNIRDVSMAGMVASDKQRKFGQDKQDSLPRYMPGVPGALRLQRRLPARALHLHARRRARAQLPVRGLQAVLHARGSAHAAHGRPAAARPGAGGVHEAPRGGGLGAPARGVRPGRPQRALPVRQRAQVQALPRRAGSAEGWLRREAPSPHPLRWKHRTRVARASGPRAPAPG